MSSNLILDPVSRLEGSPWLPGDKSISHRALILGALAEGKTRIFNLLDSGDVHSTWNCLRSLGVSITRIGSPSSSTSEFLEFQVEGRGLRGLRQPQVELDCGNSGTTLRLLLGVLAGQPFPVRLVGDFSLSRRPMKRISDPLKRMGAQLELTQGEYAPVCIQGTPNLLPLQFELPIASAQLKSAILLAGLMAQGRTVVYGKIQSRDHTERLLPYFGAKLDQSEDSISVVGSARLSARSLSVPCDFSSAAFWMAAALLVKGSRVELKNVSLNPTRLGFLKVLKRMGAHIEMEVTSTDPEPSGSIRVSHSLLTGVRIEASEIPSLIDEIPLIAVLGAFAEGVTEVQGAAELRVKESDRIDAVAENLRAMGAEIETRPDGFQIHGPQKLTGARVQSFGDHRIAMAFSIAALAAEGSTQIQNVDCVSISYPGFYPTLKTLITS